MLKFKSIFPNLPLTKNESLDILLTPPAKPNPKDKDSQERKLIIRNLGSTTNTWLSQEFFLSYFEGQGLSPPVSFSHHLLDLY